MLTKCRRIHFCGMGAVIYLFFCLFCMSVCVFNREEHVAVKIVRNIKCFREAARSEIAVLDEINSLDEENRL